jgi:quercetin dioxygenase-like cupin family protein
MPTTNNTSPLYFEEIGGSIIISPDSIVSRTLHSDRQSKVVAFGFDAGQELSEHTSSKPAIMHFISGQADITLGDQALKAVAGTWVWMPPKTAHSITATTPVVMLLTLFTGAAGDAKQESQIVKIGNLSS